MNKIFSGWIACLLLLPASSVMAAAINSLVLFYEEQEEGVDAQLMRYLVNDKFLRIDNGSAEDSFILFDVNKKTIYSVNHDDQTILNIEYTAWKQAAYDFKRTLSEKVLVDAPKIHNKDVNSYQVKAGEQVCTQVFLIKDMFPEKMSILHDYQQVLSGQQVASLKNTPEELRTPCFLLDQVYHAGDYYRLGLPVQITYSRGYVKFLKDFTESEIDSRLFVLPEGYQEYKAFSE